MAGSKAAAVAANSRSSREHAGYGPSGAAAAAHRTMSKSASSQVAETGSSTSSHSRAAAAAAEADADSEHGKRKRTPPSEYWIVGQKGRGRRRGKKKAAAEQDDIDDTAGGDVVYTIEDDDEDGDEDDDNVNDGNSSDGSLELGGAKADTAAGNSHGPQRKHRDTSAVGTKKMDRHQQAQMPASSMAASAAPRAASAISKPTNKPTSAGQQQRRVSDLVIDPDLVDDLVEAAVPRGGIRTNKRSKQMHATSNSGGTATSAAVNKKARSASQRTEKLAMVQQVASSTVEPLSDVDTEVDDSDEETGAHTTATSRANKQSHEKQSHPASMPLPLSSSLSAGHRQSTENLKAASQIAKPSLSTMSRSTKCINAGTQTLQSETAATNPSMTKTSTAAKTTMTTLTHRALSNTETTMKKLEEELLEARGQYTELETVGVVEARKRFEEFQAAAEARFAAYDALVEQLRGENDRLVGRVQELADVAATALVSPSGISKNGDQIDVSAGATAAQPTDMMMTDTTEMADTTAACPDATVSRTMVDKDAHEAQIQAWRDKYNLGEKEIADLRKTVETLTSRLDQASKDMSVHETRIRQHSDTETYLVKLEHMVRIYEEFTGVKILGVEKTMRRVDADDDVSDACTTATGATREQAFDAIRCEQRGLEHELKFTFFMPTDSMYSACTYMPTLLVARSDASSSTIPPQSNQYEQVDADTGRSTQSLDPSREQPNLLLLSSPVANRHRDQRHVTFPKFMREEIEFSRDMTRLFFSRVSAFMQQPQVEGDEEVQEEGERDEKHEQQQEQTGEVVSC